MAVHLTSVSHDLGEHVRIERHGLAAKIRLARAVLGWSQTELGPRIGLTQRAIHKLEQGETEPRLRRSRRSKRSGANKISNSVTGGMAAFK